MKITSENYLRILNTYGYAEGEEYTSLGQIQDYLRWARDTFAGGEELTDEVISKLSALAWAEGDHVDFREVWEQQASVNTWNIWSEASGGGYCWYAHAQLRLMTDGTYIEVDDMNGYQRCSEQGARDYLKGRYSSIALPLDVDANDPEAE